MEDYIIRPDDIKRAREVFETHETRDLFYRVATELVDLSLRDETSVTLAEALAVLLQTWNKVYYQYRKFDNLHFENIERLLIRFQMELGGYRGRSIEDLDLNESETITSLYQAFENQLGPVGAAKTLHLLAPKFFPLWDRAIAKAYGVSLGNTGLNEEKYWKFILITKMQYSQLTQTEPELHNPLKSIDEYNYCKFTKKWL